MATTKYCKSNGFWHIADSSVRAFGGLKATKAKCGMRTVAPQVSDITNGEPVCPDCLAPDAARVARIDAHFDKKGGAKNAAQARAARAPK